jgi:hypothetical protein
MAAKHTIPFYIAKHKALFDNIIGAEVIKNE